MTTLNDISFGLNKYCGPSVLSALTGKSTDECARVIAYVTGYSEKSIKAVQYDWLIKTFDILGFNCKEMPIPSGSLFANLSILINTPGCYMIGVPHHVVAVEVVHESVGYAVTEHPKPPEEIKVKRIYLIDNHTKTAINAASSARLMQRVNRLIKIESKPKPVFIKEEVKIIRIRLREIEIIRELQFENESDNKITKLGKIYYKDDKELQEIIDLLQARLI